MVVFCLCVGATEKGSGTGMTSQAERETGMNK